MKSKLFLLCLCTSVQAQEFLPAACRGIGVEVPDDRAATGQIVEEIRAPIFWRYLVYKDGDEYVDWHDPATWGLSIWIDYHTYKIQYETAAGRMYAVCKSEYEMAYGTPPSKVTKPR